LATELRKRSLIFCDGEGLHPSGEWPAEASYFVLGMSLEAAKKLANQSLKMRLSGAMQMRFHN
jgi:hypothetical protein